MVGRGEGRREGDIEVQVVVSAVGLHGERRGGEESIARAELDVAVDSCTGSPSRSESRRLR